MTGSDMAFPSKPEGIWLSEERIHMDASERDPGHINDHIKVGYRSRRDIVYLLVLCLYLLSITSPHQMMKMNLLGYSVYRIYNSGYNTEIINTQCNAGDSLETREAYTENHLQ